MKRNRTRSKLKLLLLSFLLTSVIPIIFAQEAPPPETPLPPEVTGCVEVWICSKWSDCINNQQTRTCTDSNNCGTTDNKPGETKDCTTETTPEKIEKGSFFSTWTFKVMVLVTILSVLGIVAFLFHKKKTTIPEKPSAITGEQRPETKPVEQPKTKETNPITVETVKTDPRLLEYIKTNLDKGFTKEQIKKELIKAGWDAKEIDKALAKY